MNATTTTTIRVVLIDDHTLVRESVGRVLKGAGGFDVVAHAGTPDEGIVAATMHRPDVVVTDIGLPGRSGVELAAALKAERPSLRVVMLTMHEDEATISRAIAAGADGYVLKSASTEELIHAIRAVAGGDSYLSPAVARQVMRRVHSRSGADLTDRELEIVRMLTRGHRPGEIARRLVLSPRTVRNHLANVYAKLGVSSAAQAVSEAFHRGLVSNEH